MKGVDDAPDLKARIDFNTAAYRALLVHAPDNAKMPVALQCSAFSASADS